MGSRTPRGVRGLKSSSTWIPRRRSGRTPRGVRGLKLLQGHGVGSCGGRTPRGVRGLKSARFCQDQCTLSSHPSRGAWVEIPLSAVRTELYSFWIFPFSLLGGILLTMR